MTDFTSTTSSSSSGNVDPIDNQLGGLQISSQSPIVNASSLPSSLSGALNNINDFMHSALREIVVEERKRLGPLLMFEDGKIKFYRGDEEVQSYDIIPPLMYDQLKIIGHASFLVVIQSLRHELSKDERMAWSKAFIEEVEKVRHEVTSFGLPSDLLDLQVKLIDNILDIGAKMGQDGNVDETELRLYTKRITPLLKAGFTQSAKLHIDLIHSQAMKLYGIMSAWERAHFRGYFHGGRGAREGNLALQYLSWLVGERTGQESERIIFTENILERQEAMMYLAKFSVERRLAELVFNDPSGLHQDVLSKATRDYLSTFPNVEDL